MGSKSTVINFNLQKSTLLPATYLLSMRCVLLTIAFFIGFNVSAQLQWEPAGNEFGYLPKSIKAFKTNDSLNGRPFIAYYIIADLRDKYLEFTTETGKGNRYSPLDYYKKQDSPYILVNGTFFSFSTNQNLNVVIREGKMEAYNVSALKSTQSDSFYYPTRSAIGITKKRKADVAWLFTDTAERWPYAFEKRPVVAKGKKADPSIRDLNTLEIWEWWKMQTAIGGGPVLLHDKKIFITNKEEQMFADGAKDLHPRTAMGYTGNHKLVILVIQGRAPGIAMGATLEEEAVILQQLGCVEALNLDGGGSSCLLVNGKETIRPSDKEGQRAVPAVFIIRSKKVVNVK